MPLFPPCLLVLNDVFNYVGYLCFSTDPCVAMFVMPGGLILHCLKPLNSDKGFESLCVGIFSSSMIFHNIFQFKLSYAYPKGSEDIWDSKVDNSAIGRSYIRKGYKLPPGINYKTKELTAYYLRNRYNLQKCVLPWYFTTRCKKISKCFSNSVGSKFWFPRHFAQWQKRGHVFLILPP